MQKEKRIYTNYRMPTRAEMAKMPIRDIIRHKLKHEPGIANNINDLCLFIWRVQGAKRLMHISDKASAATIMRSLAHVKKELEQEGYTF